MNQSKYNIKEGDKLTCIKEIKNILELVLFEEGVEYNVLSVSKDGDIILDHSLYGNEYSIFPHEANIFDYFKTQKQIRKIKLKNINKK